MATTYRQLAYLATRHVRTLAAKWGSRFVGVVHGLMADETVQAASEAVRAPWLTLSMQPNDAVPLIGLERRLIRYPVETMSQYRSRLLDAWNAYQYGGDESSIIGQLALAGYPGVQIFDPWNASFLPAGYWSHFIVYFPTGTHPITAQGPAWGSFNWGDGTHWGPVGLTVEILSTWRGIIGKWKPVEWICRKIVVSINGWTWGSGHTWGEAGLKWGGDTVVLSP